MENATSAEAVEAEVQSEAENAGEEQPQQAEPNVQETETAGVVASAAKVAEAAATAAAELAKNLALSAQNTIAAYGARAKSSATPADPSAAEESRVAGSQAGIAFRHIFGPAPAANRLVILYENNTRRMCFDAASVERVCIFRKQGRIDVRMKPSEATEPESKPESQPESVKAEEDDVIESDADAAKASSVEENGVTEAAETQEPEKQESEPEWNLARGVNVSRISFWS